MATELRPPHSPLATALNTEADGGVVEDQCCQMRLFNSSLPFFKFTLKKYRNNKRG